MLFSCENVYCHKWVHRLFCHIYSYHLAQSNGESTERDNLAILFVIINNCYLCFHPILQLLSAFVTGQIGVYCRNNEQVSIPENTSPPAITIPSDRRLLAVSAIGNAPNIIASEVIKIDGIAALLPV